MDTVSTFTAFDGDKLWAQGSFSEVITKVKRKMGPSDHTSILIFSDATGKLMDFNFHGTEKDVLKRLEVFVGDTELKSAPGPGRPRLGVISREVSMLPRHWEWLATQSGGASATLRKLVDEAKKKSEGSTGLRAAQERVYKFMSVMGGDRQGYEDALRALYKRDFAKFEKSLKSWPADLQSYTLDLASSVF